MTFRKNKDSKEENYSGSLLTIASLLFLSFLANDNSNPQYSSKKPEEQKTNYNYIINFNEPPNEISQYLFPYRRIEFYLGLESDKKSLVEKLKIQEENFR